MRLRAIDGDKGVNNRVIYSIISGPSDLFHVDRDSGIVYTQDVQLDRESDRARASNGAFVLGVRARDQDQPSQFADTEVTIRIEVRHVHKLPAHQTLCYLLLAIGCER